MNILKRVAFLVLPLSETMIRPDHASAFGVSLAKAVCAALGYPDDSSKHSPIVGITVTSYSHVTASFFDNIRYVGWDQPNLPLVANMSEATNQETVVALDKRIIQLLHDQSNEGRGVGDAFVEIKGRHNFLAIYKAYCDLHDIVPTEIIPPLTKVWACVLNLETKTVELVIPTAAATAK